MVAVRHCRRSRADVQRLLPAVDDEQVCAWIDYGSQNRASRFWTYDPIDGTKGFLRGDQYVSALALIEDGRVMVGALGCPELKIRNCTPRWAVRARPFWRCGVKVVTHSGCARMIPAHYPYLIWTNRSFHSCCDRLNRDTPTRQ